MYRNLLLLGSCLCNSTVGIFSLPSYPKFEALIFSLLNGPAGTLGPVHAWVQHVMWKGGVSVQSLGSLALVTLPMPDDFMTGCCYPTLSSMGLFSPDWESLSLSPKPEKKLWVL